MRRIPALLCCLLPVAATTALAQPAPTLTHYDLRVRLDPATSGLDVTATVGLPASQHGSSAGNEFLLSAALVVVEATPAVERVPLGDTNPFFGNNGTSGTLSAERVARYRLKAIPSDGRLRLTYRGRLNYGLSAQKEEYTRGFRETPGIVGTEGVYLAGASYWYPHLGPGLVTFSLVVHAPETWHVISQGDGSSRGPGGSAAWKTDSAMDEIYLVGGPLRVWRDRAGAVETLVYLHDDDAALANKYLGATAQYLEMYRALIGPYPYSKFALVENFWETGYGMPSFTLLGPSIVRFPFILTSSYPHEILHNWWGNSVFVDYETGNWSEGLTAYLADHLIQEQRGRGAEHRRATLQKYASYVKAGRDFPLTQFRSRDSAATEAVGYGKTLMGVHMLRHRIGDEKFKQFLTRFYREFKGKRASFQDLQRTAESVAGEPLGPLFEDWVARPGAPRLALTVDAVTPAGGEHVVRGTVRQTQGGNPFRFDVPVVVQTTGAPVTVLARFSKGPAAAFEARTPAEPVAVHVDPRYDVFRALDAREVPPSIGQIFGEPRITAVLPAAASPTDQKAWRALVESWRTQTHAIDIVTDAQVTGLPPDRPAWVLGRENRLADRLFLDGTRVRAEGDALVVDGERIPLAAGSAVVVRRHPASDEKAVGWIVNAVPSAFEGLGRKLPHYGRYSYLGFEGGEPTNTVKGEWATTDSPLSADVRPAGKRSERLPALPASADQPLVELPPTFSSKALADHVAWLAAPEREGRGIGTKGVQQAAEYVAEQFKAAGLAPGGDNGSWFQDVRIANGPGGRPSTGRNVVGVLPGANAEFAGQSALVTAHYDHLGRGWPEAHAENAGAVHPGADDNASGVAVLLELARVFASGERPPRTIVFVAFTGEEAGLVGARHYADRPTFPLEKVIGVINFDTVGRLGGGRVSILGAGTATEWPHIFRGGSFVTGVESASVPGNYEASDQRVFIERGIPAVQIFTGPHADYHRPTDTADKIDVAGLVKVATLAREAVAYLAERPTPMTVTIKTAGTTARAQPAPPGQQGAQGRRVTFGAVPDFAFQGTGVRLSDVTPQSPAARAGLRAGDVIVRLDAAAVQSLQDFSTKLRTLEGGQTVKVMFLRDGTEQTVDVTVVTR